MAGPISRSTETRAAAFDRGAGEASDDEALVPVSQVGELVAKAVAEATASIRADLSRERGPSDAAVETDEPAWVHSLALSLAQLSDQGTGRQKRVAPEVLAARDEARARMRELIVAAHARGDVPRYKMRHKAYLGEELVEPFYVGPDHKQYAEEIEYRGVPNEAMLPINDVADGIYAAFLKSIGRDQPSLGNSDLVVTPGGVVVTRKRKDREAAHVGGGEIDAPLRRSRRGGGEMIQTHVLGTVAPPARQNW